MAKRMDMNRSSKRLNLTFNPQPGLQRSATAQGLDSEPLDIPSHSYLSQGTNPSISAYSGSDDDSSIQTPNSEEDGEDDYDSD